MNETRLLRGSRFLVWLAFSLCGCSTPAASVLEASSISSSPPVSSEQEVSMEQPFPEELAEIPEEYLSPATEQEMLGLLLFWLCSPEVEISFVYSAF